MYVKGRINIIYRRLPVDYKKIYDQLIKKCRERNLDSDIYYEKHHIIPKCLGGNNDDDNLVKLTPREHYMAHYILTKIHSKEHKIFYAFLCMLRNPYGHRKYTSRMYDNIKKHYSNMMTWRPRESWFSEEGIKKLSNQMKGDNNPMRKYPEKNVFRGKSYVVGRKWYNNGIKNLYLTPSDDIPEGFIHGMVYKKRKG
jgi:hypothetical protein